MNQIPELSVEERLELKLDDLCGRIKRLEADVSLCIWSQRELAKHWECAHVVERIDREFDRMQPSERITPTDPVRSE